jgi:hypothetical protein
MVMGFLVSTLASRMFALLKTSRTCNGLGDLKSISTSLLPFGAFQNCMKPMMPGEPCQPAGGLKVRLSAGLLLKPHPLKAKSAASGSDIAQRERTIENPFFAS